MTSYAPDNLVQKQNGVQGHLVRGANKARNGKKESGADRVQRSHRSGAQDHQAGMKDGEKEGERLAQGSRGKAYAT